jgi:alpha-N-arabinofuranosidase
MDAHNSFADPNRVRPLPFSGSTEGGKLSYDMPAKAVAVVKVD